MTIPSLFALLSPLSKRLFPEVVFWPGSSPRERRIPGYSGLAGGQLLAQSGIPSVNTLVLGAKSAKVTKGDILRYSSRARSREDGTGLPRQQSSSSVIIGQNTRRLPKLFPFLLFRVVDHPRKTLEEAGQPWAELTLRRLSPRLWKPP